MITKQQIKELNAIISYLNQTESLCDEDLADKVEDIKFLVKVLTTVSLVSKTRMITERQIIRICATKPFENVSVSL